MEQTPAARGLLDYWAVLKRRRGVVYLCVASVLLATLVGSFLVTPLYRSTVSFASRQRLGRSGRLKFTARFLGNKVLTLLSASWKYAKAG